MKYENDNAIVQSIAISFFVSYMFYLINVKLPERKKQRDIDSILLDKVNIIIFSLCTIISDMVQQSGKGYKFHELDKSKIKDCCTNLQYSSPIKNTKSNPSSQEDMQYGDYLIIRWENLTNEIDQVLNNNAIIDSGFIKYLNKIKASKLNLIVNTMKTPGVSIKNFTDFHDCFSELYFLTFDLNIYFASYANQKIQNFHNHWDKSYYGYYLDVDFYNKTITLHYANCYIVNRIKSKYDSYRTRKLIINTKKISTANTILNVLSFLLTMKKCENENCKIT